VYREPMPGHRFAEVERLVRAQLVSQCLHPGAALAVYHRGRLVLDLVGGFADPQRGARVRADTLFQLRSAGKPLASVALLQLCERGRLALDAPVCTYWPAFGQRGKERVRVMHLLTHRGGFADTLGDLPPRAWHDADRVAQALEDLPLVSEPGTAVSYSHLTQQWVCAELIRRVDRRAFPVYLREEITGPLGMLETYVGLPAELERRVATCQLTEETDATDAAAVRLLNRPEVHRLPAPVFGVATARDLARFYAALAADGALDGDRILQPETVRQLLAVAVAGEWDQQLGGPVWRGLGVNLGGHYQPAARVEGVASTERTFYHEGVGTILGCGDPDLAMGLAYMCNGMRVGRRAYRDPAQTVVDLRPDDTGITRFRAICDAVRAACTEVDGRSDGASRSADR
jgi:CubicO group peptidase (beta-lactamase class C family)